MLFYSTALFLEVTGGNWGLDGTFVREELGSWKVPLISFGLVSVNGVLNLFAYQIKPHVANKPFVYWIRFI